MHWRDVLESDAKTTSEYLILSDEGAPLTQSALTQFFSRSQKPIPEKFTITFNGQSFAPYFYSSIS